MTRPYIVITKEDAPLTYTTDLKIKGFVMSRFDTPLPAVYISDKNHLQFDYNPPNFMGKGGRTLYRFR